jgi:hypothetical protein
MGFGSFMKKIFSVSSRDEEELQKYREKHGINVDENVPDEDELEDRKQKMKEYDPWEDIRNMRMNFFFGSWVTRKFRPIGEDKLKKELEELEKKRQEEEERKNAGGR